MKVIHKRSFEEEVVAEALRKSRRKKIHYYLTVAERRRVIQDCGDAGYVLFLYYLDLVGRKYATFDNARVAVNLGWTQRKVEENKRKLKKYGWCSETKYYEQGKIGRNGIVRLILTIPSDLSILRKSELEHRKEVYKNVPQQLSPVAELIPCYNEASEHFHKACVLARNDEVDDGMFV